MQFRQRISQVIDSLPQVSALEIEKFDEFSGNPSLIVSHSLERQKGNYAQRALDFLQRIHPVLGLAPRQSPEFVVYPSFGEASSGAVAVHAQQQYKGIPIFQAATTVRFTPDGALHEVVGQNITISNDIKAAPALSVKQAVLRAAEFVATPNPNDEGKKDQFGEPMHFTPVDISGFLPKVIATFTEKPDQPTVLEAGPFGDAFKARLLWFPLGNQTKLSWEVIVTMPNYTEQYRVIVDAENGEILYSHQLVHYVAARGNVYPVDGGGTRQMIDFPRALSDYGIPPIHQHGRFPSGVADTWVAVDGTEGNCVKAQLDTGATFKGFGSPIVEFKPGDAAGSDQRLLNLFYFNCYMHDFFYLLGFTEEQANFQQDNFDRGGYPTGDRVNAIVHPGAVWRTANMSTPIDGESPTMNMGLVTTTNRHTALDSTVVFHEYTHGVTSRLVGGPAAVSAGALEKPQSKGMGEGWCDYIACTINNTNVVGAWVANNTGGIRSAPYDVAYPNDFGWIASHTDEYSIGEVWCATLLEMNRRIGRDIALALVIHALILSSANPSFLDMRDSILKALYYKSGSNEIADPWAVWQGIWSAFSRFGMGPSAKSDGATLTGIVTDSRNPSGISVNFIFSRNRLTRPVSIRDLAYRHGFKPTISIHRLILYLSHK